MPLAACSHALRDLRAPGSEPDLSVKQLVSHSCLYQLGFAAPSSCPLVPTEAILLQSIIFPRFSNFTNQETRFNYLPWAFSLLAMKMRLEFSATEFPVSYLAPKEGVLSLLLENILYLAVYFFNERMSVMDK